MRHDADLPENPASLNFMPSLLQSCIVSAALCGSAALFSAVETPSSAVEAAIRSSGKSFLAAPSLNIQQLFTGRGGRDIVTARNGHVLAFHGHVLRESADGGATWSPPREIGADAGGKVVVNETSSDRSISRSSCN